MTMCIVDLFEAIQIEEKQRSRMLHSPAQIQRMLGKGLKPPSIGEHRQMIGSCQLYGRQFLLNHLCQIPQELPLFFIEAARLVVDHAKGAEVFVADLEWATDIKPDPGFACHQGIINKSLVLDSIRDKHDFVV